MSNPSMTRDDTDDVRTRLLIASERGRLSNPSMASDDTDDGLTRPLIARERGRLSNPSMTSDDSDDVLTHTKYRARARQGVEPVKSKRR